MVIFWRLLFGHLLADFALQTNFINAWKRKSPWGMLVHCAMHPAAYLLLCRPFLGEVWVTFGSVELKGWVCVLALFFLHYLEDEWRVFNVHHHRHLDNFAYFVWDQSVHLLCLFVFSPAAGDAALFPEKWPVLGSLAVGVTHFCTILVYFIEKDFRQGRFPSFDEKYFAMVERLVLAMCFLLPAPSWPWAAAAWLAFMALVRAKRVLDFSWFSLGFGAAFSMALGLLARRVWYA